MKLFFITCLEKREKHLISANLWKQNTQALLKLAAVLRIAGHFSAFSA
jgi:hypothetical protein